MGRRGPPPQPTKLKILSGNPGKRPLNQREPKPEKLCLRCPRELTGDARKCWKDIVPQLDLMGVLGKIDRQALIMYCLTWEQWHLAMSFLRKNGQAYPILDAAGKTKFIQPFPQVAIARSLATLLQRYQQEFAMTPSARTRVTASPQPHQPDALDEFLRQCRRR